MVVFLINETVKYLMQQIIEYIYYSCVYYYNCTICFPKKLVFGLKHEKHMTINVLDTFACSALGHI